MTIEQRVQQGAVELLTQQIAGTRPDPGLVLMAFNLEVRLQRFDDAERSGRRLLELAPEIAEPMRELARNARAEAKSTARLTDPQIAAKRSGIALPPPPHALAYVQAAVCRAQNDPAGVAKALTQARQYAPRAPGKLTLRNGRATRFTDLVDSDDLTGPILPCYEGETVVDLPTSSCGRSRFTIPGHRSTRCGSRRRSSRWTTNRCA